MITVRRAAERGHESQGWWESHHTFSFDKYYDPTQMGFGHLRAINEDRVAPAAGFPSHGHRDMEILSYVLEGALEHKDNLGTGQVLHAGDVQRMTAGAGMRHQELNASPKEAVHFLQIWITPSQPGLHPSYEQKHFSVAERKGKLRLLASPDGGEGSVTIHQNARMYSALLDGGQTVSHRFEPGRRGWIQVARGAVSVGGIALTEGDGAALAGEKEAVISAVSDSEILLFDLV
jgi:redox-sensitive bicupin YhaK (pirin superfamily)